MDGVGGAGIANHPHLELDFGTTRATWKWMAEDRACDPFQRVAIPFATAASDA